MKKTPIELLTKLQHELGYSVGGISTIALLGLVGESGEVLNEASPIAGATHEMLGLGRAVEICKEVDTYKKAVRNASSNLKLQLHTRDTEKFDGELADVAYYLNILAMNRGLTLEDLCQMSHDKVRSKMATPTGSSEQLILNPKKQ